MTSIQILDGPRFESTTSNIDLDTSLDHTVPKYPQGTSNFSSPSDSSDLLSPDRSGCRHLKLLNQDNYSTCIGCGVYVPKNGTKSYKSSSMNYAALFPPKTIYETMTKRSYSFKTSSNPQYIKNRQSYVKYIVVLAEELKISMNSAHLGVFLLDTVMFTDPSLTPRIQLYAPICLLVAAKTIELDARIPFIPKLKRQANSSFSVDEFRKAELKVLDLVDWNAQFSTALEIVEFLMCQGILFSTDEISDSNKSSPKVLNEVDKNKQQKSGEKPWSPIPISKLNRENSSVSDASTNGASPGDLPSIYQKASQAIKDDLSPKSDTVTILKRKKRNLTMDTTPSASKENKKIIEKKAGGILASFEFLYQSVLTKMMTDVELLKYEPKVVAAATVTFLRSFNKISSHWNSELESITQLKFSQVSECFEYIKKNYTDLATTKTAKNRGLVCDTSNIKVSELVLGGNAHKISTSSGEENRPSSYFPRTTTNATEKMISGSSTGIGNLYNRPAAPSLASRGNLPDARITPVPAVPELRKPIFNYQSVVTTGMTTGTSNSSNYSYLREEAYLNKIKPNSGTLNTETARGNPLNKRIFTNNSISTNKYSHPTSDYLGSYNAQIRSNLPEPISADNVGSYLNRRPQHIVQNNVFKSYKKF